METIRLRNIQPRVFSDCGDLQSDVWQRDVAFERGKFYLVEAASGKGKSTLCSYLIGFRNDFAGELLFDGRSSESFKENDWIKLRRCHVSYLFQELRLFPELTALENVAVKNRLTGYATDEQVDLWFESLGLSEKKHARVGKMSFGQQQRVALIRSLAQPFDFLVADEPVSHLDDANNEAMSVLLTEEAKRRNAAVIVTSIGKRMALPYDEELSL